MKRSALALAALALSSSAFADMDSIPESVVAHEMIRYQAPFMTGSFAVDKKTQQAYVLVSVMDETGFTDQETGLPEEDNYVLRSEKVKLSLEANGNIVYTSPETGKATVCAQQLQKKFVFVKYKKIKATGKCEFFTVLESLGGGKVKATLEMEVK